MAGHHVQLPERPTRPIDRLLSPINAFTRIEAAGGLMLLICTAIALIWANSAWAESYEHLWHLKMKIGIGDWAPKPMSLHHFVNDGLMAIFFFVVGLEIKREILVGELSSFKKAAVPIAAAIGGMVVPALIYVGFNVGGDGLHGWAIPMATDIAFALGIIAMLGTRVPASLKVFLAALAIADDIGAVLVIALFYTEEIHMQPLFIATGLLVLSSVLNWSGVRSALVYGVIGLIIWGMLLQSGVHATIGGVLLALTIPASMRIDAGAFTRFAKTAVTRFEESGEPGENVLTNPKRQGVVVGLERGCEHVQTPLNRLEAGLHPWVSFVIMPIFALANAGVALGGGGHGGEEAVAEGAAESMSLMSAVTSDVGLGVALGLFLGKPVGVVVATWIAVKSGIGEKPVGASWAQILGTGLLAGIGFTMSLFIANLGFKGNEVLLLDGKIGILTGSLVSGVIGFAVLWLSASKSDASSGDHASG